MSLEQQVKQLVEQHKGKRVHFFQFDGKDFWLKQPEQLQGIWRLLKPNPQKAFQQEVKILQDFSRIQAPIPKLVLASDNYLVLEDAGKTAIAWIDDKQASIEQKNQILSDCVTALIALHQRDLIHGRPAVRDIIWRDGKVCFIDFESRAQSQDLTWLKARDILIFLHSLCRSYELSELQIQGVMQQCAEKVDAQVWQKLVLFLKKYDFVYRFLCLFKPLAKTDLIAIYRLFENMKVLIEGNTK